MLKKLYSSNRNLFFSLLTVVLLVSHYGSYRMAQIRETHGLVTVVTEMQILLKFEMARALILERERNYYRWISENLSNSKE